MLGMFIILNLLLAIIYSNFMNYFQQQVEDKEELRMDYLNESFDRLSMDKDHLEEIEMYKMFILLNALALGDNSDQVDS